VANRANNTPMANQETPWDVHKAPGPRWQFSLLTHGDDDATDAVLQRRSSPHTGWVIVKTWQLAGPEVGTPTGDAALAFAQDVVDQALKTIRRLVLAELAAVVDPFL
jgi:hypothetical protein